MSNNLNLTQVPTNANSIDVPINDKGGELDAALTEILITQIDSSNADTLSDAEFQRYQFQQIDENGGDPPTAAITLTVPAVQRGLFSVFNNTAQTVTVTISGQSLPAPTLQPNEYAILVCDGTDVWPAGAPVSAYSADGMHRKRVLRATYDFSEHGGAISTIGLGVFLPDNAIITRSWYEVLTTLQSSTDAATIAIEIPTDDTDGIVAAIAISDGTDPWDAGLHEAIQDGTVANFSTKTTAQRELSMTIASEAVTAGKFVVFCEVVVSD